MGVHGTSPTVNLNPEKGQTKGHGQGAGEDVLMVWPQDPYKCLYLCRSNKMNCNNIDTAAIGGSSTKVLWCDCDYAAP